MIPGSALSKKNWIPACVLPETMFRADAVFPPMVLSVPPMAMPFALGAAAVPAALVPMRFPRTTLPFDRISRPAPEFPDRTFCSIALPPANRTMPKSNPEIDRPRMAEPVF